MQGGGERAVRHGVYPSLARHSGERFFSSLSARRRPPLPLPSRRKFKARIAERINVFPDLVESSFVRIPFGRCVLRLW